MILRFLVGLIEFCRRHAVFVLGATVVLSVLGAVFATRTLSVSTDTSQMIARNAEWQQESAAFDAAFPQTTNATTIVIEGSSADAVADGTKALAAALRKQPAWFHSVRTPDSGPFFERYGLMFLSTKELGRVSDQVAEAQPLLGPLSQDMTLRGLFGVLGQALTGLEQGEATGGKLAGPLKTFAQATNSVVDGHPKPVDWGALMTGEPPRPEQLRHFIEVQPQLDFSAPEPGAAASRVIRETAAALHLPEQGLRVRLTGDVPLEDDEIAAVTQGAGRATAITSAAVIIILLIGLRSLRLIFAIVVTLVAGLIGSAVFAAAAVGTLNMISIAFAVLFIGIGVDFGIQFSMRYRAELYGVTAGEAPGDWRAANAEALHRTAARITRPLGTAALATAVGFFSFLPTSYRGVSELGLISGTSMLIALFTTLTILPAVLSVTRRRGAPAPAGFTWAAPADRWIARRSMSIVIAAALVAVAAAAAVPFVQFDADPLDLKNPHAESTRTALELTRDKLTSPYAIDVLAPDLKAAPPLVDRLAGLPEVDHVLWLASFVPEDQPAKLDILGQMQLFLGPLLDPAPPKPAPTAAEERQAILGYINHLRAFLNGPQGTQLSTGGHALLSALQAFLAAPNANLELLRNVLLGGLPGRLDELKQSVQAGPLTLETMPPEIRSDWVSANGKARIEVAAKGDMRNERQLGQFVAAVRANAPNAAGPPVAILEAGRTVSSAFVNASITAVLAITIVLAIILRQALDVALVIAPLVLAGLFALGTCVAVGLKFNYANVIAVPLLMGIGVAFAIYFVMRWRATPGPVALLQTATARAIVFSACTTGTAFGSLALSQHAGTASMGLLLLLTLFYVVACTLFVQPALMTLVRRHRPEAQGP